MGAIIWYNALNATMRLTSAMTIPILSELPGRDEIASNYLADETEIVNKLIEQARVGPELRRDVDSIARQLVHAARAGRRQFGGIDAFMNEYGLTNEEGIILMCLAEALLRVPDSETVDRLIADKIGGGDWQRHMGHSDSLFVNASTWGLMLTGRVVGLQGSKTEETTSRLGRMVSRSGEPIIREAMRHAMRILGKQFVLGRTIEEALANASADEEKGYSFSYDMLGEAARTEADANRYFDKYVAALEAVAKAAGPASEESDAVLWTRPNLSVKLSALHPRYEAAKEARVRRELGQRLRRLAHLARDRWLSITIDAEEADRLTLSLQLFGDALADPGLGHWNGLGLAVQAYSKRAMPVLDWLGKVAKLADKRLPVRLVKGAYWDSEIKFAQEHGLPNYPVFTRKSCTDVSYLACARYLLDNRATFFPQFATHNAHTVASVLGRAGEEAGFELQRLHGMGQALYEDVIAPDKFARPVRIYAPVGGHEELLAYLVRRLLENGANTSFVHRLADDEAPIAEIIADPVDRLANADNKSHPGIPLPPDLYKPGRGNSLGVPFWENSVRLAFTGRLESHLTGRIRGGPIIDGTARFDGDVLKIVSPHDRRVTLGTVVEATAAHVAEASTKADAASHRWDACGGEERAVLLQAVADRFEANREELMAVIIREAGKTLDNALGDVREAADFLRYYAKLAREQFGAPKPLHGPTGEENVLSLHGRGVIACISPWNFPLAIFTGQVAAALAAGNSVLAKPAEQTPLTAFLAVKLMHEAGIPHDVLHLLPGRGETIGTALIANPAVAGVAFTGSNDTARIIQRGLADRPGPIVPLIAETGGINAMIVDSTALPEQVVRDAVYSAFDSAGQRCSALRVLYLQEDIADSFLEMLLGAIEELQIGDPFDYGTDVGPVIDDDAARILENHKAKMRTTARELIDLPIPERASYGSFVAPAAYEIDSIAALEREVFGPILHVVRFAADRIDDVCDAINATGYGLTLGLHTRIGTRADHIARRVRAGNIYVNRNQIGAVVGVQPFGGEGLSGTGPKAGGPNTLLRYAVERACSSDITASGGNPELLSLRPHATDADED